MTDAATMCWHQSEPSDRGVFRCTKPKGHDGPHQSGQAHWWSDPPSYERSAASKCCYRSVIVLDFTEGASYRRCPVHGETDRQYPPPLTLARRFKLWRRTRAGRRRLREVFPA